MGFRTLFDASSGAAAFAVAKRLSHLLSTPPGVFRVLAGRVWAFESCSTQAAAQAQLNPTLSAKTTGCRWYSSFPVFFYARWIGYVGTPKNFQAGGVNWTKSS